MTRRQGWAALGIMAASCSMVVFTACGSSSSGPPSGQSDATTGEDTGASSSGGSSSGGSSSGGSSSGASSSGGSNEASTTDASDSSSSCAVYDASGLNEASVAAGFAQVWQVYRCQSCHQNPTQTVGEGGTGIVLSGNDAGLGDSGLIWPPNLTNDPATGLGCWTDPQIQNAILNGQDPEGGALCPPMPVWGHALMTSDGGVRAGTPMDAGTAQEIIDFLRSLPPVVNHLPDTTCAMPDGGSTDANASDASSETGSGAGSSDAAGG
jgi:hypothetical protein